jgi:ParB/RepB/Spo0J family partition protein
MADKKVTPKLVMVQPKQVFPNDWNPNRMNDETFEKEVRSIETNGFIDPITIREVKDAKGKVSLEIVDGEHRWRAATKLGIKEIPAVNLGDISDEQAKKLTIIANELRGAPEPALLAALLKDLNESIETSELALHLPMSQVEIDALIKGASTFDWAAVSENLGNPDSDAASPIGQTHASVSTDNPDALPLRLGSIKGELPAALVAGLSAEYERSAAACGSRTPEVVMGHWLTRLKQTSEQSDEEAANLPKPEPKKKRAKKDKEASA